MPLVIINVDREALLRVGEHPDASLRNLAIRLREWVAEELSCSGDGHLESHEVEVTIQDRDPRDLASRMLPLRITVLANDYPERRANLEERCRRLSKRITDFQRWHGFVWIRLAPAAFCEF